MCLSCGLPDCDGERCGRARAAERNRSLARLADRLAEQIRFKTITATGDQQSVADEIRRLYAEAVAACRLRDASAGWRALKRARRVEFHLLSAEELIPMMRRERLRARHQVDDERADAIEAILDPFLKTIDAPSWPAGQVAAALGPALTRALPVDEGEAARLQLQAALGVPKPKAAPNPKALAAALEVAVEMRDAHNDEQHATRDDISHRLVMLAVIMSLTFVSLAAAIWGWVTLEAGPFALPYIASMGALAGALGACASASQKLVQGEHLPTMFTSRVVTLLRPIIGLVAGLFAVLGTELLTNALGVSPEAPPMTIPPGGGRATIEAAFTPLDSAAAFIRAATLLTLAFAAGFSERILISALDQPNKKPSGS